MNTFVIALQNAPVTVAQGSWLGNISAAGFGVALLVGSHFLAKKKKLLWGPGLEKRLSNVNWDWKSLMSCLIGFLGMTAVLGSTGLPNTVAEWGQGLAVWLGELSFFSWLGMGGLCFLVGLKVFADAHDSEKDIVWGGVLAVIFPLGGGIFAMASVGAATAINNMMNGIPMS